MSGDNFRNKKPPSTRMLKQRGVGGDLGNNLTVLLNQLGLVSPIVPKKWRGKENEYWDMMNQRVDEMMVQVKQFNQMLDLLEESNPELMKDAPWYEERQKFKQNPESEELTRYRLMAWLQRNPNLIINRCLFGNGKITRSKKAPNMWRHNRKKRLQEEALKKLMEDEFENGK